MTQFIFPLPFIPTVDPLEDNLGVASSGIYNFVVSLVGAPAPDILVSFDGTDPNTLGTSFTPTSPELTTALYYSEVDGSTWVYDGTVYVSSPALASGPAGIADALGNMQYYPTLQSAINASVAFNVVYLFADIFIDASPGLELKANTLLYGNGHFIQYSNMNNGYGVGATTGSNFYLENIRIKGVDLGNSAASSALKANGTGITFHLGDGVYIENTTGYAVDLSAGTNYMIGGKIRSASLQPSVYGTASLCSVDKSDIVNTVGIGVQLPILKNSTVKAEMAACDVQYLFDCVVEGNAPAKISVEGRNSTIREGEDSFNGAMTDAGLNEGFPKMYNCSIEGINSAANHNLSGYYTRCNFLCGSDSTPLITIPTDARPIFKLCDFEMDTAASVMILQSSGSYVTYKNCTLTSTALIGLYIKTDSYAIISGGAWEAAYTDDDKSLAYLEDDSARFIARGVQFLLSRPLDVIVSATDDPSFVDFAQNFVEGCDQPFGPEVQNEQVLTPDSQGNIIVN